MAAKIKTWLSPPVFENDAEKTRMAGLLNLILWAFMAALVLPIEIFWRYSRQVGIGD